MSMSQLSVPRHSGEMKSIRLPPWFEAKDRKFREAIFKLLEDPPDGGPAALLESLQTKHKLSPDQAKALLNAQIHPSNSTIMTASTSSIVIEPHRRASSQSADDECGCPQPPDPHMRS